MAIVLLVVGLLVTATGFITIGFGIPINAFSLGNTLIVAGTVAVATGLILIGLAAAIGQLRRIAEALNASGLPRPSARTADSTGTAPTVKAAPAATPAPARPSEAPEPSPPEPRLPEPRSPASAAAPAPGPLDWLRAKPKVGPAATVPLPAAPTPPEPPVLDDDEVSLSPRPPQRQPSPAPVNEPSVEPKVWSPSRGGSPAPRLEQPMPRATPQPEPPKTKDDFDLVWPDRGATPAATEPAKPEPLRREPEMPLPPLPVRPRVNTPVTPRPAPEPRGPAILKSGVIDGMPYTLYADGSIEAELAQGTVKFASVDALRAHLEKQS
jgi:hypothetical protein